MKKSIYRSVGLALTVAVLTGGLVGCKAKDNKQAANTANASKPTTIVMTTDTFLKPEDGMAQWQEKFKAQTGVELKITQLVHNQYYEKLNLQFASNEIPDALEIGGTALNTYANKGALYDMTKLVQNSEVLKNVDKKYKEVLSVNGKIYALPVNAGGGCITYVRKDWLDKAGLQAPKTYDEFINMLKAFKKIDGAIPYSAAGLISDDASVPASMYLREFYQDAVPDFTQVNGKWVDGMLQPNMKDALKRLKEAYDAGLIDKEIITNKTSSVRDKFYAGKVGVMAYWAGDWNRQMEINLQKAVKDGKILALPAIEGVKYYERSPVGIAISKNAKNPEGVFKYLLEYMHDGGEGETIFTEGFKDWSYEVKDGKNVKKPGLSDPKLPFPKIYEAPEFTITGRKSVVDLDSRVSTSLDTFKKSAVLVPTLPVSDAYSKAASNLLKLKQEVISKIVYGQMTIDEGLAKYEKESKTSVDSVLKDFNK
jgi:putative aldouronate transport system substrate-binding protein